ncbi:aldehyde dehydrogenase family protein [Pseudomonas aeruginosa]|uniref:aldehyde dehydrogenase family protein n=1 Tax=Pseudomonas aeruginosa TaxID=287 RepID=UPI000937EA61|nr:aldehyde dehydrogenase family protein [Pseudomonas aeruginosa]ELK7308576.1 aldehyde dehydrogenase family protein [Pseudomonas aeruginosa]ELP0276295.1 aldehyde dehydrogenase family protein [Pseudomonas aeruginosa]MBI7447140.1 aldehyde dehydrogenase family protein [Pseudomonas aeruginosa]MBW0910832.1 aldehyde dehydrogenase family protein [Pseudomonas aeruginosa]MBW1007685.1 aldehyde dehydrogenase family protein [Pseudomonas aeruginosa]
MFFVHAYCRGGVCRIRRPNPVTGEVASEAAAATVADAIAEADAVVVAMVGEIGATEGRIRFNVALAASMLREALVLTTQVSGSVILSDNLGGLSMVIREPASVVLGITPWNAPIIFGVRALATPLACGNSIFFRASEICPPMR